MISTFLFANFSCLLNIDFSPFHFPSTCSQKIKQIVEGTSVNLVEHLASEIAKSLLKSDSKVHAVDVTVKKPHVNLPGILDYVGVQIHRTRSDYNLE
jgi:FolB domain-containing protein